MYSSISIFKSYSKWIMDPLVVILGATGTGKSKLALELATKFRGEIISADSMQIYKGLDILTNKVTTEELSIIKHHMLNFVNPLDTYTVVEFRDTVLPIIKCLHKDKILPIIVGGTHYYVESILWNVLVQSDGNFDKFSREVLQGRDVDAYSYQSRNAHKELMDIKTFSCNSEPTFKESTLNEITTNEFDSKISKLKSDCEKCDINNSYLKESNYFDNSSAIICNDQGKVIPGELSNSEKLTSVQHLNYNDISNEELLKGLEEIDPEIASRYHPNDRRKILRSLEVWHQTGVRHSEHLRRQSDEVGGADLGGKIRFKNALVLWITCEKNNLDSRLDARVDEMLEKGLIRELSEFNASCNFPALRRKAREKDNANFSNEEVGDHYQKGIFQSIGLKGFHEYLLLDDDERQSEIGDKLLKKGVELMKLRTRQYAKRQEKWMKNRFLIRNREKIPVYALDGNDLNKWNENVVTPAIEIIQCLLKGDSPIQSPVTISADHNVDTGDKTRHFCDTCQRIFIGNSQWEQHMKSKKHRTIIEKINRISQKTQCLTKRSLDKGDKQMSKIQKL